MSASTQHIAKTAVERAAKSVTATIYVELMDREREFVELVERCIQNNANVEQTLVAHMRDSL